MPSEMPFRTHAAYTAWTDLAATVRSHPFLTAIAVAACTAASIANVFINPEVDTSARAIALGLGLAVTEAFLITPILLAASPPASISPSATGLSSQRKRRAG